MWDTVTGGPKVVRYEVDFGWKATELEIITLRRTLSCHGLEYLLPYVQWHLTSGETMLPFLH
jgi:hypothetical protein